MRIAINDDVAEHWRVPASIVPNSVDTERFSPGDRTTARAALGLSADGKIVSYVGFLYPAKGFRELISAAGLLRDQRIEATFLIVGGGIRSAAFFRSPAGRAARLLGLAQDYEAEARLLVAELRLEDSVRFISFTDNAPVVYRASDVIAAPSQGPEIGRPLLEGAAAGIAAVGTGSTTGGGVLEPGVTTIFTDGMGADALAAAIGGLLRDPARREAIGAAARVHALSTFAPTQNARLVVSGYERLLAPTHL